MNKKNYLILSLMFNLNFAYADDPKCSPEKKAEEALKQTFIVDTSDLKKNASKNDMKEKIGEGMKNTLNLCSEFSKISAEIQIKISEIQTTLFSDIEDLIDNGKQFKRASRNQLKQSHGLLKKVNSELSEQLSKLKQIKKEIDSDATLKAS